MRSLYACAWVAAAAAAASAAAPPVITWASHPIQPNQTLLLQVSPLAPGTRFQFNRLDSAPGVVTDSTDAAPAPAARPSEAWSTVDPSYITAGGAAVVVPATLPRDAVYTVTVVPPDPDNHVPVAPPPPFELFAVNEPDLVWLQASEGEAALPGGWARVFGRSLGWVPIGQIGLAEPPNPPWETTLRLTPLSAETGGTIDIKAAWQNSKSGSKEP